MRSAENAQVVKFIQSLDRPEEKRLFSEDVAVTHPHILDAYSKVCPHRMDLHTMKEKAQRGGYYRLDDKYDGLVKDVDLMVRNCITFNHDDAVLCQAARNFHAFAKAAISRFVEQQVASVAAGRVIGTSRGGVGGVSASQRQQASLKERSKRIEQFVLSLNRVEDEKVFAQDVAVTHPYILEAYNSVCPQRMDLATMAKNARQGRYSSVGGFDLLETDLKLIVDNCCKFNGAESYLGQIAKNFSKFVQAELEKLRSQLAPMAPAHSQPDDEVVGGDGERTLKKVKLESERGEGKTTENHASLKVDEAFVVVPFPHQVAVAVPLGIRMFIIESHLKKTSERCRLPAEIPVSKVLAAFVQHVTASLTKGDDRVSSSSVGVASWRSGGCAKLPITLSSSYLQLVKEVVDVITRNFNALFPRVLLYNAEKADVLAFIGQQQQGIASGNNAVTNSGGMGDALREAMDSVPWVQIVGCRYLIRFLVHLPQMSSLIATAEAKGVAGGRGAEAVLVEVARRQVDVITVVVEDLLSFIDAGRDALLDDTRSVS